MINIILLVLALFVLQTLLPASCRYLFADAGTGKRLVQALGPRDTQPPLGVTGERAARALNNMLEALPVFLTLALLHVHRGTVAGPAITGAWVFLAARIVYVPAYLAGTSGLRSAVWGVGWVGLGLMIYDLLAG